MQSLLTIVAGKIVAILIGVYCYKFLPKAYRYILLQVTLALVCEVVGEGVEKIYHKNNLWIFNLYLLAETWLNGLAGIVLLKNKSIKVAIHNTLFLLTVIWIINVYSNGMQIFANWCFVASAIATIIIYMLVLFNNAFSKQSIFTMPAFWLSISIILFFGCDLPYFGLRNYLLKHSVNIEEQLYYVNYVLNFLRYPLIAICFFLCKRQYRMQTVVEI
ncbi:MAG: hypothetical protein ACTHJ0_12770 [Flavipsychrobacter sp.]